MFKCFFILLFPLLSYCQNSFYIGLGTIASFAKTDFTTHNFLSKKNVGFSLTYGNTIKISDLIKIGLELHYHDNKFVLSRKDQSRFELHQNVGLSIRPGINIEKHSVSLIHGITGVYVFDKNENTGNQLDRYDEAWMWGTEYSYKPNNKIILNVSYIFSNFESLSLYTGDKLISFSTLELGIKHNIY